MNIQRVGSKGFTIVELIVVIAVIGILAVVGVVGYGAWRTKTAENVVKSDLTQVSTSMENARNFNDAYPISLPSTFQPSSNTTVTFASGDGSYYCVNASSTIQPTVRFYFDSRQTNNPISGACGDAIITPPVTPPVVTPPTITNLAHSPQPSSTNYTTYYARSSTSALSHGIFNNSLSESSYRITRNNTSAVAMYIERANGGMMTALAGDVYGVKITLESNASATLNVQIGYGGTTSMTNLGGTTTQNINLTANTPRALEYSFTVPSGFDGQPLFLRILWSAGNSGEYIQASKLMVYKDNSYGAIKFADGTSSGWTWSGTANGSTSSGPALYP
ncbi:MAG: prepilin-type N-terminal cleavage/methylation domain-containing protein [Candidatus Microsaccharimonas sp.]